MNDEIDLLTLELLIPPFGEGGDTPPEEAVPTCLFVRDEDVQPAEDAYGVLSADVEPALTLPSLAVDVGTTRAWFLTISAGLADQTLIPTAAVGFTGDDVLSAQVWPGDDTPAIFAPPVVWIDPAIARVKLTIPGNATANVPPGRYQLRATVTPSDGLKRAFYRAWLDLKAVPGTRPAPAVYGTADDVLGVAPWLTSLQTEHDQTNFAEALGRARSWLDGLILKRWVGADTGRSTWSYGVQIATDWHREQLAGGALIVTDETLEIVCNKAVYFMCRAQLGKTSESTYQALGARCNRTAESMAKCYIAELLIGGGRVPVALGVMRLR